MAFFNSYPAILFAALISAAILSKTCEAGYFPADLKLCKADDNTCIRDSVHFVLRTYAKGYPDMGLIDVSQVNLTNVVVSKATPDTPVQLNLAFETMVVSGMENSTVDRVSGFDGDSPDRIIEAYVNVPKMVIDGIYNISGRVLLLPLNGNGRGHIEISDLQVSFKLKCKERIGADGKKYLKLLKVKTVVSPRDLTVHLDGLFNGNEELGNSMNKLINDNWRSIWDELQTGISNAISESFRRLVQNVTDVVPYTELFINLNV